MEGAVKELFIIASGPHRRQKTLHLFGKKIT